MADRLKVHGKCPKCGHTATREAEPGKVTWRGECGKDGCNGRIIARRTRTPDALTEPTTTDPKPPARKVQKVGYQREKNTDPNVQPTPTGKPPANPPGEPGGTDPKPDVQPTVVTPPPVQRRKRSHPYGGLFGW